MLHLHFLWHLRCLRPADLQSFLYCIHHKQWWQAVGSWDSCHDRDRTYPYSPYPDLSTPILSCQNHPWAPLAKPEPSGSILSQLASNAFPNPLTPLHLDKCISNTIPIPDPTRCSFDLSSSSRQVDSRHPHSFPTQCHSTFTLLCQDYSRRLIGLATAVGQSPIAYLSRSMRPSPSFLALYICVSLLSVVCSSVTSLATLHSFSMSHPQFPVSVYPCFIYLYPLPPSTLP